MMRACKVLASLDISDMQLQRESFEAVALALVASESLAELRWNNDLESDVMEAKKVMTILAQKAGNQASALKSITMTGVFTSWTVREDMKKLFPNVNGVSLCLAMPDEAANEENPLTGVFDSDEGSDATN